MFWLLRDARERGGELRMRVHSCECWHALVIGGFRCCFLVIFALHYHALAFWFHCHFVPFLYNFIVFSCPCFAISLSCHALVIYMTLLYDFIQGARRGTYVKCFFFLFLVNMYVFIFPSKHVSVYIVREISFRVLITY